MSIIYRSFNGWLELFLEGFNTTLIGILLAWHAFLLLSCCCYYMPSSPLEIVEIENDTVCVEMKVCIEYYELNEQLQFTIVSMVGL
jgi:hypothetical protein